MNFLVNPIAIPIVAMTSVFAFLIISAIVDGVSQIVKHRNEIELKQSLVDRGMSADEIERIILVSPTKARKSCCSFGRSSVDRVERTPQKHQA